jgi:hypothetical protein
MKTPKVRQNQHIINAIFTIVLVISAAVVDTIIASSLYYDLFKECRKSMPRRSMTSTDDTLLDAEYAPE